MPSIRRRLQLNVNESKNTRMDIAHAGWHANWRPDELAHISRYCKIAEYVLDEAKRLERPLDCFEAGCGQIWTLRYIYKGLLCKKDDQVRSYIGFDIDPMVLDDFWGEEEREVKDAAWFQIFNGRVVIRDLTTEPHFDPSPAPDGLYDMFWTTEVIEHMKPEFIEPWLNDAASRLRPGALAYISTPNSDGSREKLPKDHVYEWGFQELKNLLESYFELVRVDGVFIQHPSFNKVRRLDKLNDFSEVIDLIKARFDPNWQRVILAMFYPEVANNCAWTLRKR